MKFSVFQISRKGGRPRNEDRMGYCYTRDAALFLLAMAWEATRAAMLRRNWPFRPWRRASSARRSPACPVRSIF